MLFRTGRFLVQTFLSMQKSLGDGTKTPSTLQLSKILVIEFHSAGEGIRMGCIDVQNLVQKFQPLLILTT